MEEVKIYSSADAIRLMGIICAKASVDLYIGNMYKDGLLRSSDKLNGRWRITEEDILYIRGEINARRYKPSAKYKKAA